MGWLYLSVAILMEVAGTTSMKLSEGLTRPTYVIAMFLLYGLAFVALALAMRTISLGVAYALWAGIGTALIAVIAAVWFAEPISVLKGASIGLIVAGVIGLHLA